MARIKYGLPSPEGPYVNLKHQEYEESVSGGCCFANGISPAWYCKGCGNEFGTYWEPEEEVIESDLVPAALIVAQHLKKYEAQHKIR